MQPQETTVTRTFLATATALIAAGTLLSSGAQACISCEYVPEVVRAHQTNNDGPSYHKSHSYSASAERALRASKKRIAKSESVAKSAKIAKVEKQDKPEKIAKVAKSEPVKVAKADPVEATAAESENSAITVAAADTAAKEAPAAKVEAAAKPTDCKKFFASVGMTLTVPCEQ
jgi:hypothetical protein